MFVQDKLKVRPPKQGSFLKAGTKEGITKMQHFFPLPGHDLFYNAHIPALGKNEKNQNTASDSLGGRIWGRDLEWPQVEALIIKEMIIFQNEQNHDFKHFWPRMASEAGSEVIRFPR